MLFVLHSSWLIQDLYIKDKFSLNFSAVLLELSAECMLFYKWHWYFKSPYYLTSNF